MQFTVDNTILILKRTPSVLSALLADLPQEWTSANEGGETWSVFDIIGHLIHGELTDWIPRAHIILSDTADKCFEPFDRWAQFRNSQGKDLSQLLEDFKSLRAQNLQTLSGLRLAPDDLKKTGIHPEFGDVTLAQLIATWAVHDLNHLSQVSRVLARQYEPHVGPWRAYLGIFK